MFLTELFVKASKLQEYKEIFQQCRVDNVSLNKSSRKAEVLLSCPEIVPKSALIEVSGDIKKEYELSVIKLHTRYAPELFNVDYYKEILYVIEKKYPQFFYVLKDSTPELNGDELTVRLAANGIDLLMYNNVDTIISGIIREEFSLNYKVTFLKGENVNQSTPEEIAHELKQIFEANAEKMRAEAAEKKKAPQGEEKPREFDYRKRFEFKDAEISAVNRESGRVTVKGQIFTVERKDFKNGDRGSVIYYVTDNKGSVMCRFIGKLAELDDMMGEFKEGDSVKISGETNYDKYIGDFVIEFKNKNIEKVSIKPKTDDAPEKRIELHLHTSMSAIDGINDVGDYIKRAKAWGHTAVAVTDHGVVQAFPDAYAAASKAGVKLIYGVEGYLVDDLIKVTVGEAKGNLKDEAVVFDIETTGLSAIEDVITEIGACRVKNGQITERFSTFVNPNRPIPAKIVELTGITDAMVKDAPGEKEALSSFLSFVGDAPVIAHNANFDVSFIRKACERQGMTPPVFSADTLGMSRNLIPNLSKHNLKTLSEYFKVKLEGHHRAVNDAEATAEIYNKLVELYEKRGVTEFSALNSCRPTGEAPYKGKSYHVIILVKNREGLKNLYKLVSSAHIEHFYKHPRILKSEIEELREGLLIGSACEAGELYRAVLEKKPREELLEIADFYDFFEVQPLGNNRFMLDNGTVSSEEELQKINIEIIELGKTLGKKTVATGDVHFMNEDGGLYRAILMSGKKFKDVDNQPPLYYRTTDEMLKEFSYLPPELAYEIVVENTNWVSGLVDDDFPPVPKGNFPPVIDGAAEEIKELTYGRAHAIYGDPLPEIVQARIEKELNSIINNGFSVMYLIAQKLVHKTNSDGFLVGSRGSVGSSFVAFLSGITEVNSLKAHYVCPNCKYSEFDTPEGYTSGWDMPDKVCPKCGTLFKKDGQDIPFETFLGFEGDKEPDIDLNFAGEYQPIAHKYIEELFGEGHVFRAGTIGTIAEKTAYGYVKKYFEERGRIINNAETARLVKCCTGAKATTGQHPGGVIIVPKDNEVYEFTPIQHPANDKESGIITTHFDYHKLHDTLLKLDILGHDDPAVLKMLEDLTGLKPTAIPMDDKETMSIFLSPEVLGVTAEEIGSNTGTFGVPEFGTKFVRGLLEDTRPQTFEELVRISGLSHGTNVWLDNAQKLVEEGIPLKSTICTRDDIMLYLISCGMVPKRAFTIMEQVRKGKGLKDGDIEEMKAANVPQWYIDSCLKIAYLFPKAHAVAYVTMALRVAYYKVHYPLEYYCAYYTVRGDDFDASIMAYGKEKVRNRMADINAMPNPTAKDKSIYTLLEICNEMYSRGLDFLPVDLYKSHPSKFTIEDGKLRPPLISLKGLGLSVAESIAEERKEPFFTKEEFIMRTRAGSSIVELLSEHGCFEGIPDSQQIEFF